MSVMFKMKNPIFNAHDLYVMVRLSMIKYFPYEATNIKPWEVLTIYLQKAQGLDFEIDNEPDVRGLTFRGKSYDMSNLELLHPNCHRQLHSREAGAPKGAFIKA